VYPMCNSGLQQEFGESYEREYCAGEFDLCVIHSVFAKVSGVSFFGILSLVCDTILLGLRS
jgi:hypothetical protein